MTKLTSKQFDPIRKEELSSGDARRSREVSHEEFQSIAHEGAQRYAERATSASPTAGTRFDQSFARIVSRAHKATRQPWGGVTVDAHTGRNVAHNADAYALTVRPPHMNTVSVPADAPKEHFEQAMHQARQQYEPILSRADHHLGVFHDADKGTIDIDPVLVTKDKNEAEAIGAYTRNVGGAYHFKSGDGYWPPHVRG